jgi:hypothetical protein
VPLTDSVPLFAAASGISAIQIYNIETGRTVNSRESTKKTLESALGVAAPSAVVERRNKKPRSGAALGPLSTLTLTMRATIRASPASMSLTT